MQYPLCSKRGHIADTCPQAVKAKTKTTTSLTLYVPIIAILDIWKTTLFNEGKSVVYDGFKCVWPVKGFNNKVASWHFSFLDLLHT